MGEGFNLRRDVFMRVAVFVKNLNMKSNDFHYTLVLPPWGRLYHWQSRHLGEQVRYVSVYHICMSSVAYFEILTINKYRIFVVTFSRIPWSQFFDTDSINRFVPVIELEEYLKKEGSIIDTVYYLQNYAEGWKDGKFEEKHDFRDCIDPPRYHQDGN